MRSRPDYKLTPLQDGRLDEIYREEWNEESRIAPGLMLDKDRIDAVAKATAARFFNELGTCTRHHAGG